MNKRTLILILACLMLLSSCKKQDPADLVYGLTLSPSGIDPHINASSELGIPLQSVYDTLVYRDPETADFLPGLAHSWSLSADELHYTFNLRSDVVFHDGTPFNADAVRINFERILNPDNHSQKALSLLGPLQSVSVENEYTVVLHLSEPYGALLDALSQVYTGMASPAALDEWGTEYQFHQVGTGPYRFIEFIPNDRIVLELNKRYSWAPSFFRISANPPQRVIFRFYTDPATRALALESGEADIVGEIPPHDAARMTSTGTFDLLAVPIPGQPMQYFFNTTLQPTDDVHVREALFQALDRTAIVNTVFGASSQVAEDILSAEMPGFPSADRFQTGTPAAELLDQAGWILDTDSGIRVKNNDPLSIRVAVPSWGMNPEVSQLMRAAWENLGAQVEIQVLPGFGQLKEVHDSGEFHLIGLNFFGTDPALLTPFYSSDGLYNWSKSNSPELDAWLKRAASLRPDSPERQELYNRIADSIREDTRILPIRDYVNLVLYRNTVSGLRYSAEGWFPLLIELTVNP